MDYYGITSMEKFAGTPTDITIKNHYTWVCPVYFSDEILQVNLDGLTKWETRKHAEIYIGHSKFHAVSVALVLNSETSHVSPQFHLVFDDEFSTFSFMREGTIIPNWTDIVQRISQRGALENIDIKDTWFTPDLEEYTRKTQRHEPSINPDNSKKTLMLLQSKLHLHEGPERKRAPSFE